jgi:hypothetical protein
MRLTPDHDAFHGRHGEVVRVIGDDAGEETGDPIDSAIYRVRFDDKSEADFRRHDLRPPLDE